MEYKLTVVIPTYNAQDHLLEAVESVKNQTIGFDNIELILVDDNSTDDTKSILNNLCNDYENISTIFLKENNGSPSKARNRGIEKSTSKYIMFLDSDDYFIKDCCEKMYNTIKENDVDVITFRHYELRNKQLENYHCILDKKNDFIILNSIDEDDSLLSPNTMGVWNKIYKKEFLLKNDLKFIEGSLYEDVYFSLNVLIHAKSLIFLNNYYGYVYKINENDSISTIFNKESLTRISIGLNEIFGLLEQNKKDYYDFKASMLIGFLKWDLLTKCELDYKLKLFKKFKKYFKQYKLLTKLEHINISQQILINLGIKFICLGDFCFKLVSKIILLFVN